MKLSRSRGQEGICIKLFQEAIVWKMMGLKVYWEALMPRLWRWADRVMVVVMAIPLSGFVELLSIVFSADHCNRRQGSIVLF